MASLDSLPADQRAVIQLVLQQRRSYDDIAGLLAIDRAGVRQRALDAFDALGPTNSIPAPQRALLTDYLLGQLPGRLSDQVRDGIAGSPGERAWLRVIGPEVGALASDALPEIPAASSNQAARSPAAGAAPARAEDTAPAATERREPRRPSRASRTAAVAPAVSPDPGSEPHGPSSGVRPAGPPASRRGGAIVLGLGALLIVAVVVVVLLVTGGGKAKHHNLADASTSTPATASTPTTSTTSTTSTTPKAKFVTQVNLNSPTGNKSRKGVAQVLSEGTTLGVLLVAQNVPANSKTNAYAVWLYNSGSDNKLVGFVNSRVGSNGKLETEGPLPANASHYKHMLVTLETRQRPTSPGPVVLEGALKFP